MAIIHTQSKVLEKSILVGINVQIAVICRKKTVVFGKYEDFTFILIQRLFPAIKIS